MAQRGVALYRRRCLSWVLEDGQCGRAFQGNSIYRLLGVQKGVKQQVLFRDLKGAGRGSICQVHLVCPVLGHLVLLIRSITL